MFVFFWILAAMGVAYAAKISGASPALWFAISMLLSPLAGVIAFWAVCRYQRR